MLVTAFLHSFGSLHETSLSFSDLNMHLLKQFKHTGKHLLFIYKKINLTQQLKPYIMHGNSKIQNYYCVYI